MKSLLFFCFLLGSGFVQAKVITNYTYLKAKNPTKKSITIQEVKRAYQIVRQSTFAPPTAKKFFDDYLRFKLGIEVALNERRLIKNPNIEKQIANPFLKMAFQQELYKALAELKLKNSMKKLDRKAKSLSKKTLKKLYASEPEFNIFFISINIPINPNAGQKREAKTRAKKIHAQIIRSKKPFLELVAIYSDDKSNGTLGINRTRASIFPAVYNQLKKMKPGDISNVISVPSGYFIVKLNRKVPFFEANKIAIKANYFNKKRTSLFNNYFDGLKKDFKVNIVNRAFIKTL